MVSVHQVAAFLLALTALPENSQSRVRLAKIAQFNSTHLSLRDGDVFMIVHNCLDQAARQNLNFHAVSQLADGYYNWARQEVVNFITQNLKVTLQQ
jgi:hypothetical protein